MAPSGKRARKLKQAASLAQTTEMPTFSVQTAAAARAARDRASAAKRAARVAVAAGATAEQVDELSRDVEASAYLCVSCGTMDAGAFSNRMAHKRGRHGERIRRCTACIDAEEDAERACAAAKPDGAPRPAASGDVVCACCGARQGPTCFFSRNQLGKGAAARCQKCVRASAEAGARGVA